MNLNEVLSKQKEFFLKGNTLSYKMRKSFLLKLKEELIRMEPEFYAAIAKDLGKSETETYMCEIGLVLSDICYQIKHLKKNMKCIKKRTPLSQFKAKSYILPVPYGNTLILSPWNYPILLSLQPLIGAISAGNTVILKPSEFSFYTSQALKTLISNVFPEEYVSVILGDKEVASYLLELHFDYIFFTGGTKIGREIACRAAQSLTPITLELGGKSPVIVDHTANLSLAAKRIVFGKFLNAGQTCVAPDYLLVEEIVKEEFIHQLVYWIQKLYPNALENVDYVKIINEHHFNRLISFLGNQEQIIYGGKFQSSNLKIEPTLMEVDIDSHIMKSEIFGPILPIMSFKTIEDIFPIVEMNSQPLALYLFSTKRENISTITKKISFGGGCINDTIIHLANHQLPFGGIGSSGIGSYHGKKSFETFSHYKSIVSKSNGIDLPFRYTPYDKKKLKFIKQFLK